jgi:hypothetical protein
MILTTSVRSLPGLDRLMMAFERHEIALPRDDALIHELFGVLR